MEQAKEITPAEEILAEAKEEAKEAPSKPVSYTHLTLPTKA